MKPSTALRMAQYAVMEAKSITREEKLEIIKILLDKEDLALYREEAEAKKG